MKRKKLLTVLSVLVIFAATGIFLYKQGYIKEFGSPFKSGPSAVYICPMHPSYVSDRQGECPICGMALVETNNEPDMREHEGSHHDGSHHKGPEIEGYKEISLSPEKQRLIGIRTVEVKKVPVSKVIRTVGHIAYDAKLYQAQEEYLQSLNAFKKSSNSQNEEIKVRAAKLVESARVKLELMGLNQDLISELEQAGQPDKTLLVARPGEKVWMYAPIYEQDLDAVRVGQSVLVTAQAAAPGMEYKGTIRAIDPVLDPQTRSVNIRVQLENPEGILRPNVFVNAEINVDYGEKLLIPEGAVLDSGARQIAFVDRGEGHFEPRTLGLGARVTEGYILLSGVRAGEPVVDQATFFVDSESRLKAALAQSDRSAEHEGGHSH